MLYCQLRHTTLWPPAQYTGAVIFRNPPYFSLQIEPWSPPAHLSRAILPLQQSCLSATADLCSAAEAPLLCCCGGNDEFYGRHPFSWFALNTSKLICNPSIFAFLQIHASNVSNMCSLLQTCKYNALGISRLASTPFKIGRHM